MPAPSPLALSAPSPRGGEGWGEGVRILSIAGTPSPDRFAVDLSLWER